MIYDMVLLLLSWMTVMDWQLGGGETNSTGFLKVQTNWRCSFYLDSATIYPLLVSLQSHLPAVILSYRSTFA
jgi:hypothetical protein